ncbi:hypothetical protein CQ393_02430 [Stenotrophomonas sp. MYb238]|nr:hypothetical protein [Stenotrophomonas sp. MYb238]
MATMPITQEEVSAAIESLLIKGKPSTQCNVRHELGGRGSSPRLKRMIAAWYAEFGPVWSKPPASTIKEAGVAPATGEAEPE